jgi:SAM-dependent methyltransferase
VLCQFGAMFFPDKLTAFREALRVLRPGSRFLFSVWAEREGSVWEVATNIVGEFLSRDPASLLSPPYNDIAVVGTDLAAAGFAKVRVEKVTKLIRASSAREAAVSDAPGSKTCAGTTFAALTAAVYCRFTACRWSRCAIGWVTLL